ncbi:sorbitol-6-phosphate dehydrogenase [Kiritimatiella glycovorans]|uniref:Sorbitol-6-phosphate 2-dehydrogenase n=1 Tax=Kiritimatiella glycovorans TaxID=1307763 RepID=A0A0G3EDZ7_9BACT|nr:sorbitol-6-phosphate dehydrogenase [Kiritimatiella glycovorans]AKJ64533.1 Sorbitol-6-phosphate 2-dehydrogenase [Kiritimatiella glycovorans]
MSSRIYGMLEDRKAVITGAAQGLGEALAVRLAREGCDVLAADLKEEDVRETAEKIGQQTGRRGLSSKVDVTDDASVGALFDRALEEFGRVDVVVANAGVLVAGPVDEIDPEKWRFVMNVNLFGYFLTARHAVRAMKQTGGGSIVQINSKSGKKGSAKNSAYAASKFGGVGLTQSLGLELAEAGIRCNSVCPGNLLNSPLWVNSLFKQYARNQGISEDEVRQKYLDQVPLRRSCEYEDVENAVIFLASDLSSYMTGQAINVTGGQEMR